MLAAVLVIAASVAYGQQQQVIRGGVLPPREAGPADDAGQYRLLGLTPGSYFVMADIRETWTVVENGVERIMGYAQTCYPGTPGFTDARRVPVGVGEEANNTDFALIPGRAATVSGTVFDSQGRPVGGRQLALGQEFRGPGQTFSMTSTGTTIAADGTFRMTGLAPGVAMDYVQDGSWNDPEYLESIRRYDQRFRLGESGTQTVALRLVSPQ